MRELKWQCESCGKHFVLQGDYKEMEIICECGYGTKFMHTNDDLSISQVLSEVPKPIVFREFF